MKTAETMTRRKLKCSVFCLLILMFYHVNASNDCPKVCHCGGYSGVDCSKKNLTMIPENIPLDVEKL